MATGRRAILGEIALLSATVSGVIARGQASPVKRNPWSLDKPAAKAFDPELNAWAWRAFIEGLKGKKR